MNSPVSWAQMVNDGMQKLSLSDHDVAAAAGVSTSSVAQWRAGGAAPRARSTIVAVAALLELNLEEATAARTNAQTVHDGPTENPLTAPPASTNETMADLIDIASVRHRGASARSMADIASRGGHFISHSTINRLRREGTRGPSAPGTIAAVAFLAGVETARVARADGRTEIDGPSFASQLPDGVDELLPSERDALLTLISSMVRTRRETNSGRPSTQ